MDGQEPAPITNVECPACHSTKSLLAWERHAGTITCSCECGHVWDIAPHRTDEAAV